jgi:hypothetical protein
MGPELLPRCADRGQPSVGLAADRVSPGAGGLTGKAALLRSSLSENHRGGVRHRMYSGSSLALKPPHETVALLAERTQALSMRQLLVLFALALLALSAGSQTCERGAATWPVNNDPITGDLDCSGSCTSPGLCEIAVDTPAPNVFEAFCSCDGSTEPDCCHLIVTFDSSTGQTEFTTDGECQGDCPGPGPNCEKVALTKLVEGVVVEVGWAPACRN